VIWDPATLFFGDLVRGDVEALVHLHFVRVHYLRWLEVFCHAYGPSRQKLGHPPQVPFRGKENARPRRNRVPESLLLLASGGSCFRRVEASSFSRNSLQRERKEKCSTRKENRGLLVLCPNSTIWSRFN